MRNKNLFKVLGATLALVSITVTITPVFAQRNDPGRDRDRDFGDADLPTSPPPTAQPKVKVLPPEYRPGQGQWRLGVTVDTTDVGVVVRDVAQRSAAARLGLERGDVIVAINGYQIGRVMGRVYPLDDELQRRASPRGEVRLLVQDRRTLRLLNMDVRLDRWEQARDAVVRGQVTYRERMALPSGAELRIQLERRTPKSREVVFRTITPVYGTSPIPFDFRYPIEAVRLDGDYGLTAEIWSRGSRLFTSRNRYPITPGANESGVELQLKKD